MLLTTHYLDEAQALCDRVAIVKDGRILAEGPPATLGAAASRYRVTWRDEHGELHTREEPDPTPLLHQLTSGALARGEQLRDLSVSRPRLEDVYLELTAEDPPTSRAARHERGDPRLAPVPARAPDVLAQPDRGVLQLRPAADLPRAVRRASPTTGEPEDHRPRHRRAVGDGDDVQRARQPDDVPARRRACSSACTARRCPGASYLAGVLGNAATNAVVQVGDHRPREPLRVRPRLAAELDRPRRLHDPRASPASPRSASRSRT